MKTIKFIIKNVNKFKNLFLISTFLLMISTIISSIIPYTMKIMVDEGIVASNRNMLFFLGLVNVVAYVLLTTTNYCAGYKATVLSELSICNIKKELYNKILHFPLDFFSDNEKGYILARINEVNLIKNVLSLSTIKIIWSVVDFIITTIILCSINYKIYFITIINLPIYYFIVAKVIKRMTLIAGATIEQSARANSSIQEILNGISEVKSLGKENRESKKIDKINEEMSQLSIKQGMYLNATTEILSLLTSIIIVGVLVICGAQIINSNMTLGDYFAFSGYLPKIIAPVQQLALSSMSLLPSYKALERVIDFFYEESVNIEETSDILTEQIEGKIKCNKLGYQYKGKYVFRDLSFTIMKGQKVLLCGSNGSGKSTLIKILVGLYDNYSGEIFIDENDLKRINKKSLIDRIGIVSQNIFLFNTTIKDNILYSTKGEVSDQEFYSAIYLSGVAEWCNKLPEGVNTMVGENGCLLSGGEKQMIAIARVIVRKPDLVIFDEATSNLDHKNTLLVLRNIMETFKDKTCIFVLHNIQDRIQFDNIINLNEKEEK